MKDETLREALRRAAGAEPSTGDPFARFESVRRRNALARGGVLAGVSVFLILSFAFVFPNPLRSGSPAEFPSGGELDPLPRDVRVYQDPVTGFRLEYPAYWRSRGEHGRPIAFFVDTDEIGAHDPHTDLFRASQGYIHEVPRTFYVEIIPGLPGNESGFVPRDELERLHRAGAIITDDELIPQVAGQRRIDQLRVIFGESPMTALRRISYWCQSCRLIELTVRLEAARGLAPLHVRIVAPDQATLNAHLFEALPLLDSIERLTTIDRL